MRVMKEVRAISTLFLILLILCSLIVGALVSYMWVMGSFYLEPENAVDLIITDVNFPRFDSTFFTVTVLNPSHSTSATNITDIYLTVEEYSNVTEVTSTYPELPIPVDRATLKTIRCDQSWGEFAGNDVTVHISTVNASGVSRTVHIESVGLTLDTSFNATESVQYLNVTITYPGSSTVNLTLNKVMLDFQRVENLSIELPIVIHANDNVSFQCFFNWEGHSNPLVRVETLEGYAVESRKDVPSMVSLQTTDVKLSEENMDGINLTFNNSPESATLVDITDIVLTYDNGTQYYVNGSLADPPFSPYYRLAISNNVTFNCVWPWRDYRNRNVTVTAYTKQGFTSLPTVVETPKAILYKITGLDFNLAKTGFFLVNVTNLQNSLQNVTITNATLVYGTTPIWINNTIPQLPNNVTIGNTLTLNCTLDWTSYKGKNVTINVYASQEYNSSDLVLPTIDMSVTFNSTLSTRYFNVSIQNKASSTVNITGIDVNGTSIEPMLAYPALPVAVEDEKALAILCPLDWPLLSGNTATITVSTSNDLEISVTVQVP